MFSFLLLGSKTEGVIALPQVGFDCEVSHGRTLGLVKIRHACDLSLQSPFLLSRCIIAYCIVKQGSIRYVLQITETSC